MGAILCIGKDFRLVPPGDDGGTLTLTGSPIDVTNMSWSSITELREVAEQHLGIPAGAWPFYAVDFEDELDLEDVKAKCSFLRATLAAIPPEKFPDSRWLREFVRLLGDGWDFCAKR
jgi:hypothetical protein